MSSYTYNRRPGRNYRGILLFLASLAVFITTYLFWHGDTPTILTTLGLAPTPSVGPGDVLGQDSVQVMNSAQTAALIKQNYGASAPPSPPGITKVTFHYRSEMPGGEQITVYGRAYLPAAPQNNLPIFAFAPGTTGISDVCAPSLEQPAKANWANYDSHMAAYAAQGFAAVITDYEGMRDPTRIHHYMVGELEGRAVLDSVRALRKLPESADRLSDRVFLGGYSQGGHAAFWADKIAAAYAPDVRPTGVVGFGPVLSVRQTLTDVIHGANINWFGPYVLYSYRDYYRTDYGSVILPHWEQSLAADIAVHCIDTVLPHWGHSATGVYTPEFLSSLASNQLATQYPVLNRDLELNEVGAPSTPSAKRINQGEQDNVVLPSQQQALVPAMCRSSTGPVQLHIYPSTTHYDTMLHSLNDTLGWMRQLINDNQVDTTCG